MNALYENFKSVNSETEKYINEKIKDENVLAENKKIMDDFCSATA